MILYVTTLENAHSIARGCANLNSRGLMVIGLSGALAVYGDATYRITGLDIGAVIYDPRVEERILCCTDESQALYKKFKEAVRFRMRHGCIEIN